MSGPQQAWGQEDFECHTENFNPTRCALGGAGHTEIFLAVERQSVYILESSLCSWRRAGLQVRGAGVWFGSTPSCSGDQGHIAEALCTALYSEDEAASLAGWSARSVFSVPGLGWAGCSGMNRQSPALSKLVGGVPGAPTGHPLTQGGPGEELGTSEKQALEMGLGRLIVDVWTEPGRSEAGSSIPGLPSPRKVHAEMGQQGFPAPPHVASLGAQAPRAVLLRVPGEVSSPTPLSPHLQSRGISTSCAECSWGPEPPHLPSFRSP